MDVSRIKNPLVARALLDSASKIGDNAACQLFQYSLQHCLDGKIPTTLDGQLGPGAEGAANNFDVFVVEYFMRITEERALRLDKEQRQRFELAVAKEVERRLASNK